MHLDVCLHPHALATSICEWGFWLYPVPCVRPLPGCRRACSHSMAINWSGGRQVAGQQWTEAGGGDPLSMGERQGLQQGLVKTQ